MSEAIVDVKGLTVEFPGRPPVRAVGGVDLTLKPGEVLALLASMPSMDPDNRTREAPLFGDPPNPIDPPSGCRFHTRCKFAAPVCSAREPGLGDDFGADMVHRVACHMVDPSSGHPDAVTA